MRTILLCGHRAYAARNLENRLKDIGYDVLCFSRGKERREGNVVTGDVKKIDQNPFFYEKIDIIINFILLKDGSFKDNIEYIAALCRLAKIKKVGKLIHLSSISSYPNDVELINDETDIEHNAEMKGHYGAKKVIIDEYLNTRREIEGLPIIFFRPGFITASDHPRPLGGIARVFLGKYAILMGNKKSSLPLVSRDEMQHALLKVIETTLFKKVYIVVADGENTKANYIRSVNSKLKLIGLPKNLTIGIAYMLKMLYIFDERKWQQVRGLFKVQHVVASTF